MSDAIGKFFGMVVWGVIYLTILCIFLGVPVWILWNLLMPALFQLPVIGFWEAVGLNLLCTILFKSSTAYTPSTKEK